MAQGRKEDVDARESVNVSRNNRSSIYRRMTREKIYEGVMGRGKGNRKEEE